MFIYIEIFIHIHIYPSLWTYYMAGVIEVFCERIFYN